MIHPFAQVIEWGSFTAQLGVTGAILGWFMMRAESKLQSVERAIDRLSKVILLELVSRRESNSMIVEQAKDLLRDLERKGDE